MDVNVDLTVNEDDEDGWEDEEELEEGEGELLLGYSVIPSPNSSVQASSTADIRADVRIARGSRCDRQAE